MTTAGYELFKLIRGSRPGTRVPGATLLTFDHPNDVDRLKNLKDMLTNYELRLRGCSNLLIKPIGSVPDSLRYNISHYVRDAIKHLYNGRWLFNAEGKKAIDSLPAPDKEQEVPLFSNMLTERLQTLAKKYQNVKVMVFPRAAKVALIFERRGCDKVAEILVNAEERLASPRADLGAVYDGFTKLFREIEFEVEQKLKDPSSWPSEAAITQKSVQRATQICERLARSLTANEKELLRNHPGIVREQLLSL